MSLSIEFIKSAKDPEQYPSADLPEIAMVGRSNAGKSSFINAWMKHRIAKVSQVPGKTRLLQFFNVSKKFNLVDMPGYGFTTRSRDEILDWNAMVERYFFHRVNLCGVMLIMDIRRPWDTEDQTVAEWLAELEIPLMILLNKADKLSRSQIMARQKELIPPELKGRVFTVSALKKTGISDVEDYIFREWIGKYKPRNLGAEEGAQ